MSLSRLVARPLIASGILYGAQGVLRNPAPVAPKAAPVTDKIVPAAQRAGLPLPEDTVQLVRLNAAAQIVGALAIGTGRAPRLGAAIVAASLVPTTIAGHAFWAESDPAAKKTHTLQFFKNLTMIGSLIVVAGDTDGKPGVAWRTRRAAKDAQREAKHLRTVAKAKVS
ncbi:DoxX family protein [Nocardioides litoris]|uniref:DoxX family protein n=1 Tax=Nocardioides litoris TaxID=1926648 RepID=UPI0011208209|nr:DoxX family protein [Nocardioides litoris]